MPHFHDATGKRAAESELMPILCWLLICLLLVSPSGNHTSAKLALFYLLIIPHDPIYARSPHCQVAESDAHTLSLRV